MYNRDEFYRNLRFILEITQNRLLKITARPFDFKEICRCMKNALPTAFRV